ncbi:MAG: glycosyltransferase family 2 protein [Cetobacterium sp.]
MNKVSVIIPVYNVQDYIERCLDSVLHQTYSNLEIIIVNDGATDNSEEKIYPYLKKNSNIKYFKKKNGGLSSARNFGIYKSTGDYLMFLDSDDWIDKEMVEEMINKALTEKSDFVVCGVRNIFSNGKIKKNYTPDKIKFKDILYKSYACNKLIKKKIFIDNKILYPENEWFEDVGTTPYIYLKSKNPTFIEKDFYNYFQREGSITKQKSNIKSLDLLRQYVKIKKYLIEENLMSKYSEDFKWASNYVKNLYLKSLAASEERFILGSYKQTIDLLNEFTNVELKDWLLFVVRYIKFKMKFIIKLLLKKA